MTSATAPVAAEIIAGRPPRKAMETAMVNDANRPTRGSTPAMMENEIASGMSASATTSPARTSVRSILRGPQGGANRRFGCGRRQGGGQDKGSVLADERPGRGAHRRA